MYKAALMMVTTLLLGGCLTRPETVVGDLQLARSARVATTFDNVAAPGSPGLVPVPVVGRVHTVLVLSGGGSDGAFGAGVLVGLTESGLRPNFDVVTGVSNGALMATLAFLGSQYDGDLRKAYTGLTNKDVFKSRGIFGVLKGSLNNQAPLEKIIAGYVNESLLAAIASEHAKGRRLYVATTNLDTGLQSAWDMGKIASSQSPEKVILFRQILLASAAVPGVFKPIFIRSTEETPSLHVDGGVRASLLFRSFMLPGDGREAQVWTVVSSQIRYERRDGRSGVNLPSLLGRSITEMLSSIGESSVFRTYSRARNGMAKFKLAYIPDDVPEISPIDFNTEGMARLFEAGRALALGNKWASEPPLLERLDRVH